MPNHPEYIKAASLADLKTRGIMQVRAADRPVALFWHHDRVHAVDDRCPHLGFPLHKGTVHDGLLTCHWHHARFDLCSGCAFDLFADDIPTYDTRIDNGHIYLAPMPRKQAGEDYYRARLKRGLEQNIGLVQAKSVIGLLHQQVSHLDIIRHIALFGAANHDNWSDGMTSLALMARLWPRLSAETAVYGLALASRRVARNCSGQPSRRERHRLENDSPDPQQLQRWFDHWLLVRHRDGSERTLLTAARAFPHSPFLNDLVFGALHHRIYSNTGHTLDFANKAFELLDAIGWDHAGAILPTLVPGMASARGEQERSAWRNPVDLIPLIENAEQALPDELPATTETDTAQLRPVLLGENPRAILDSLLKSLQSGTDPLALARELAYVAALRLARFPESNDINDWFNPVHTFTYSNALCQSLRRSAGPRNLRGLFHVAMSVYADRFLNIPEARIPGERPDDFKGLTENPDGLLSEILENLNHSRSLKAVTARVAFYLRLGHPLDGLVDTLAAAIFREDLDFHFMQTLEAALQQATHWHNRPEAEHIFVGVSRHLAAHCPTRRADSHLTRIALRLHRGDPLYESEDAESG